MKCEGCGKKLSKIRNFFKKYPFGLQSGFWNGKQVDNTIYFCSEKCKVDLLFNNKKMKKLDKEFKEKFK